MLLNNENIFLTLIEVLKYGRLLKEIIFFGLSNLIFYVFENLNNRLRFFYFRLAVDRGL